MRHIRVDRFRMPSCPETEAPALRRYCPDGVGQPIASGNPVRRARGVAMGMWQASTDHAAGTVWSCAHSERAARVPGGQPGAIVETHVDMDQ
jgi:hypothetical protein